MDFFKVYQRLEKVIDTETMIAEFLPKCPNYVPPIAVFDMDYSSGAPTVTITSLKKGKKGRKPGSGKGLVTYFLPYHEFIFLSMT